MHDMGTSGGLGAVAQFLDLILVALSIWMAMVAKKGIGGLIGSAINWMALGIIILGFAHYVSTLMSIFLPGFDGAFGGVFHRFLVLIGFLLLGYGFLKIDKVATTMKPGYQPPPEGETLKYPFNTKL